jgi:hypothetical protein
MVWKVEDYLILSNTIEERIHLCDRDHRFYGVIGALVQTNRKTKGEERTRLLKELMIGKVDDYLTKCYMRKGPSLGYRSLVLWCYWRASPDKLGN